VGEMGRHVGVRGWRVVVWEGLLCVVGAFWGGRFGLWGVVVRGRSWPSVRGVLFDSDAFVSGSGVATRGEGGVVA